MQVIRTHDDETGQVVFETEGYDVKVVVEPVDEDNVYVAVWDAAGLSSERELRPADQADAVAIKTLFDNHREDKSQVASV